MPNWPYSWKMFHQMSKNRKYYTWQVRANHKLVRNKQVKVLNDHPIYTYIHTYTESLEVSTFVCYS